MNEIAHVFEMVMLICFGLSWPFNIAKSLTAHTAKGKSAYFEMVAMVGYVFGLAGKWISGNVNYVVFFYILDLLMVATDLVLTLRNQRLDRLRELEGVE